MIRLFLAAFLSAGLSFQAAAQMSPDFRDTFGQAEQRAIAGDHAEAFAHGERAYAIADTPEEQVRSLHLLAEMSFALERYSESENLAGSAMALMREHFSESVELMQRLLVLQGNAALQLGDTGRWRDYMNEAEQINAAETQLHWIVGESGLRHRLSAYDCPQSTEMGVLYEPLSFDLSGFDVGCKYVFRERTDIVVTMHVYRAEGSSLEQTYTDARESLELVFQNGTLLEENEIELAGHPVSFAIVRLQDRETGVWTTQIGDWSVKLRMTHFGNATRADFDAAAEQTFANTWMMAAHAEQCAALTGADEMLMANEAPSFGFEGAVLLASQVFDARSPSSRLACLVDDGPLNDDSLAYAELNDAGEPLVFTARDSNGRGYSVHAVSVELLFPGSDNDQPDPRFVAYAIDSAGYHVFGMFETAPSPEGFSHFARSVADGSASALARVEFDESGNSNIVLTDFGEDSSE